MATSPHRLVMSVIPDGDSPRQAAGRLSAGVVPRRSELISQESNWQSAQEVISQAAYSSRFGCRRSNPGAIWTGISSRCIPKADDVRRDWRGVGDADFALTCSPWCYLNTLQVAVEKTPSLAFITGSQNPLGHLGVGLMKSKVTPAFSTHQSIALRGIGLRDEQSTGVTTLHRVSH